MKQGRILLSAALLLFIVAGCSGTERSAPPEPVPDSAELSVSDLKDILDALDLSAASLAFHSKTEEPYPAGAAICAENYMDELRNFSWQRYLPSSELSALDENDAEFYRLTAPNATITSFLGRYDSSHPIHVVTDHGDAWFVLPQMETEPATQTGEIIYKLFSSWYNEAKTASLCSGTGTPLTAKELENFRQYTESIWTEYNTNWGSYHSGSTEISCFFTSFYDDVRKLNFEEFMRYFPGDRENPAQTTDAELEALKQMEDWPFWDVESLEEMPVPVHKYPRTRIDAVLMKYAGITTAELDTTGVAYLAEYDAFYNYSSDFGPGMFIPYYGEKTGDTVTLWNVSVEVDGSTNRLTKLTLHKNGENWQILSHQSIPPEN